MNLKILLIIGVTLVTVFSFPLLTSGPTDATKSASLTLILYVGLVAVILAWEPRKRP